MVHMHETSAEELERGIFNLVMALIDLHRVNGVPVEQAASKVSETLENILDNIAIAVPPTHNQRESK